MRPVLDLSNREWVKNHGDLTFIGTWIEIEGSHKACMVIIRTNEERHEATMPCVITADKAWVWSEDIGNPRQAAHIAVGYLDALRMERSPRNMIRIASLIHDHLGDLLSIPPYTTRETYVAAELTITNKNDGSVREVEVVENV